MGLSERNLLEGNRNLITVTTMILIRYLVFEIVVIKGDAREKNENKNKTLKGQGNLKMAMCSKSPRGAYQYFNFSSQHKWAVVFN